MYDELKILLLEEGRQPLEEVWNKRLASQILMHMHRVDRKANQTAGIVGNTYPVLGPAIERAIEESGVIQGRPVSKDDISRIVAKVSEVFKKANEVAEEKLGQALEKQAYWEWESVYGILDKVIHRTMLESHGDFYKEPKESTIRRLLGKPIEDADGNMLDWKDRFANLYDDQRKELRKRIASSITSGDDFGKMANKVMEVTRYSRKRAMTLARTETLHVSNEVQQEVYEENKEVLDGVTRVATLDSVTCLVCASEDGKSYTFEEKRPFVPAHPDCRCCYAPKTKSWSEILGKKINIPGEGTPSTRVMKTPEAPKGKQGVFKDYEEWFSGISDSWQKEILGATRYDFYKQGTFKVKDFIRNKKLVPVSELTGKKKEEKPKPVEVVKPKPVPVEEKKPVPAEEKKPEKERASAERFAQVKEKVKNLSVENALNHPDVKKETDHFRSWLHFNVQAKVEEAKKKRGELEKIADKKAKEIQAILHASRSGTEKEKIQADQRVEKMSKELDQLVEKISEQNILAHSTARNARELIRNELDVKNPPTYEGVFSSAPTYEGVSKKVGDQTAEEVKDALARGWSNLIDKDRFAPINPIRLNVVPVGIRGVDRTTCMNTLTGDMYIEVTEGTRTPVHEFGHWFEAEQRRAGNNRPLEFLKYRAGDETPEKLSVLCHDKRFTDREVAYRDKWARDMIYSGKVYREPFPGAGQETEIISMGLEHLDRDPIAFSQKDPEYFNFMIAYLKGIL